jgi:hypothetical protein
MTEKSTNFEFDWVAVFWMGLDALFGHSFLVAAQKQQQSSHTKPNFSSPYLSLLISKSLASCHQSHPLPTIYSCCAAPVLSPPPFLSPDSPLVSPLKTSIFPQCKPFGLQIPFNVDFSVARTVWITDPFGRRFFRNPNCSDHMFLGTWVNFAKPTVWVTSLISLVFFELFGCRHI